MWTPRKKFVTTWILLEFDKNSKPVCAGQVLSELFWVVEQIRKENAEKEERLTKKSNRKTISDLE